MRQRRGTRIGPVCLQPAKGPLEGRGGVVQIVEALTPFDEFVAFPQLGRIGAGPMDGGQCLTALDQQPGASGIVELTLYLADDRLSGDLVADEIRIAQSGRRIGCGQDVWHRCSGLGSGGLHRGLEFHARELPLSGRGSAQDQRPPVGADDGVEGVGDSAGSAGERAQVLHGDVLAENRPQNTRELVDHPWSLLGCPNLNIRWATRRIWISSAPSVMR